MPTLWVYVIMFFPEYGPDSAPFIESEWPTELSCRKHRTPDYDGQWLGACKPIEHDWVYVTRAHR